MPLSPDQRLRRAVSAATVAGCLTASVLLATGGAAARPAPADPSPTAAAPPGTPLANGDRLELRRGGGSAVPGFRVLPTGGRPESSYAYSFGNGALRVAPADATGLLPATTVRTGAPKATPKADVPLHTATITITNGGLINEAEVVAWNRSNASNWEPATHREGTSTWSARVVAGSYLVTAVYQSFHSNGIHSWHVLTGSLTVSTGDVAATLDELSAHEIALGTDQPTAERSAVNVEFRYGGWGTGLTSYGTDKVYVTPFSLPNSALTIHETQTRQGASAGAPSPYRYDLFHDFGGTVTAPTSLHPRTADLATTVTPVRAQVTNTRGTLYTYPGDLYGPELATAIAVPSNLTEYVTPGVTFHRGMSLGKTVNWLGLPARTLPAGTSPGQALDAAPFGTRLDEGTVRQEDDRMGVTAPFTYSTSDGQPGTDDLSYVSYALTSGGQQLGAGDELDPDGAWEARVPTTPTNYELTQTVVRRVPYSRLSTAVKNVWDFTSDGEHYAGGVPLVDAGLSVSGLDIRNTAGAAPVTLDATASTTNVAATDTVTGLDYSTDDGSTWIPLPLNGSGAHVTATLDVPPAARFVSLRIRAGDDAGRSTERTMIRAFAGPTPQDTDESSGPTHIQSVKINDSKAIVLGTTVPKTITATFNVVDPVDTRFPVRRSTLWLWHGSYDAPDGLILPAAAPTCTTVSDTTSTCTETLTVDPRQDLPSSALAGYWYVAASALSEDGHSYTEQHEAGVKLIQRYATLTSAASPASVAKGKPVTITGRITRASWDAPAYYGYAHAAVVLQFHPANSSTYVFVKNVTTNDYGNLTTTAATTVDGYWRYYFYANETTSWVSSTGDYIDVR